MRITITDCETSFDNTAAWRIIGQVLAKPESVIGLSTGRTTGNMHRLVGDIWTRNPFDVSKVTFFGLDEVTNVPREYYGACFTMIKTELTDTLGIPQERFLMLPTMTDDWEEVCRQFTDELAARGGVDLFILGLGENGHLGFNQPGTPFGQTAWKTSMHPELEERISRETGITEGLGGVTLGIADIMRARKIVLVAKGKNKAEIVHKMFNSPITPEIPATILRLHPNVEFLLDAEAAALIK